LKNELNILDFSNLKWVHPTFLYDMSLLRHSKVKLFGISSILC
jgi:hypothetical protein